MNEQAISLRDFWNLIYFRRYLALGVFLAVVLGGATITFLLPPTYESTMKILVTRNRIDPQVTAAAKGVDLYSADLSDEDFNSELEILQSRAVIEGTVKQLGLDHPQPVTRGWWGRKLETLASYYRSFHKQAAPTATERAVTQITDNLDAVSIKKSRILKVSYRDSDAERAAQFLNTLYREYADHHLHLHQSGQQAASVFRNQSAVFQQQLSAAAVALKHFDAANGTGAGSSQRDLLLAQLQRTEDELAKAQTDIRETNQRLLTLKEQLAAQPERIEAAVQTKYVAARDKIKDEITHLEMQHTNLRQKYQPTHRLVKDVEEQLVRARELLVREEQAPPQERTTVLNEVHQRLTNELLRAQADLGALSNRAQSLAALVKQHRVDLTKFDTKSLERAELERTRSVNEEAYLLYSKKAQEAEIGGALIREKIANISLAEPATVNHRPVSPKLPVGLALSALLGLLFALTTVLFLERQRLPQPHLGPVLPSAEADLLSARRHLQEYERQLSLLNGRQAQLKPPETNSLPAAQDGLPPDAKSLPAPETKPSETKSLPATA